MRCVLNLENKNGAKSKKYQNYLIIFYKKKINIKFKYNNIYNFIFVFKSLIIINL